MKRRNKYEYELALWDIWYFWSTIGCKTQTCKQWDIGFPRSLPSPYSCHHLIGIAFVPFVSCCAKWFCNLFWGGYYDNPFFCALKVSNFTLHKKKPLWRSFQVLMLRLGTALAMGFQGPKNQSKTTRGFLYKNIYLCRYLQYVFTR